MPDILIRGMEMPTGELNYREIQVWSDGTVCVRKGLAGPMQQTDAKAVELPPHGDLIDRDYIQRTLKPYSKEDEQVAVTLGTAKRLIQNAINAPVVIPAEEGETQ